MARSAKYQMTFHIGSGDSGAALSKILDEQTLRLGIKEPTKTLRVALRILAKIKKDDANLKEALAIEL